MRFRQVHLDFHTSEKIPDIGTKFNKEQFQKALLTGHVNSITLFSKCHHGYALDCLLGRDKTLITDLGSIGVVNLMKQNGQSRYVAHMLYAATARRGENIDAIEDIYPVFDTELKVKLSEKVNKVYLAPQKKEIPYNEEDGYICVNVEKVDCHQMIVFDIL